MTSELAVDTALIRHAAELLDEAADAFGPGAGLADAECPLTDNSLGSTALAREVAGAARRRVRQGIDSAAMLARSAAETAAGLRRAANTFEIVESAAAGGRR